MCLVATASQYFNIKVKYKNTHLIRAMFTHCQDDERHSKLVTIHSGE